MRYYKNAFNLIVTGLVLAVPFTVYAQKPNPQNEESSRQIVLDRFNKARPPENSAPATARRPTKRAANAGVRPVYRRTTPAAKVPTRNSEEIGITIWRLRPSRANDGGARVLVLDGLKQEQWVAERVEADTPLRIGDRVRISVESPRSGYLYIVDREQYRDGSQGEPVLIFPTLRARGGDNRLEPGKLIDIPAQEDQYSYFTAQPGGERRDQIAEVLTFVLTADPLTVPISEQPLKLTAAEIARWERSWQRVTERLELVGGAGRIWTDEEKQAGTARGIRLNQSAPSPQTVYRVAVKKGSPLLVTVPLRYGP